jgi:hypothetical protein
MGENTTACRHIHQIGAFPHGFPDTKTAAPCAHLNEIKEERPVLTLIGAVVW